MNPVILKLPSALSWLSRRPDGAERACVMRVASDSKCCAKNTAAHAPCRESPSLLKSRYGRK